MKKLLFVISVLSIASCGTKQTSEIPVLDVTKSYPEKKIVLQDIADVEYIALETADNFLIDYVFVRYMDDDILIMNNQSGDIMTFDRRTGKALHSFNRTGRGPGEYSGGIHSIAVDRKNNEMFMALGTLSDYTPIYAYDLQGNHIRTLRFEDSWFPRFFHNYDDGHVMMYNDDISQPEPYKLMSKTDTVFTLLPVRFEGRDKMAVTQTSENGTMTYSRDNLALAKTGEGYVISETGVDTIYRWNTSNGELLPLMTRTPRFHSMELPIGLYYLAESGDYIFLRTCERKFDFDTNKGFDSKNLIYDKTDGRFYEGGIVNGDIENNLIISPEGNPGLSAGVIVIHFEAYMLTDLYAEGKLCGKLAEIAASGRLKEDDNPVLMIATLKQ